MSGRDNQLSAHVRRLGNHALNELLLELPKARFAALVDAVLVRPVLPAGLVLRFEPDLGVDGWRVVACAPRRQLGTVTRHQDPAGRVAWRAWTRAGGPGAGLAVGGGPGTAAAPVEGAGGLALAAARAPLGLRGGHAAVPCGAKAASTSRS